MYDNITKPFHCGWYPSGVEAKEVTDDLPRWLGDAITYIWRRNHKGQPIDDRRKAIERLNEATPGRLEALEQMLTPEIVKPLLYIEPDPDPLLYDVRVLITVSLLGIKYRAWQQMIDLLKASLQAELDDLTAPKPDPLRGAVMKYMLAPGATAPTRATEGAAGYDLTAKKPATLIPGERALVSTGVSLALPAGLAASVRPRSGLAANHGITVLNTPGLIDPDYRGEIKVILYNAGHQPFWVNRGDRIAQLTFEPIITPELEQVDCLDETERGTGGFGSTGR